MRHVFSLNLENRMKMKGKGKIHPSPPPVTAPSASQDSLSVLNLLPAAILSLAAVLSIQDREVLAYMITRSLKTTTTCSINSLVKETNKFHRSSKQLKTIGGSGVGSHHKPSVFDCDCFDCYTSFWFRWDSSPNRELIHQAIEAFEEHLASGEVQTKRSSNRRSRKKEKLPVVQKLEKETQIPDPVVRIESLQFPVDEASPEILDSEVAEKESEVNLSPVEAAEASVGVGTAGSGHRGGFARKVLPVVLGVFNSRLWDFWGPNV
uniref:Uncharacterized protein n=1 Tax=Kalanchoe fedtschenkoi TaxID=63787 RepID=A0A7N0UXT1_KALFE